jgi:hypothetical protein
MREWEFWLSMAVLGLLWCGCGLLFLAVMPHGM